jgi:hypothetical protein
MVTHTSKNKEQTHQQKSAANTHTAGGISLPAVPVLQPMSKNKVAQLYSLEAFGKLSEGRQMLLQSNNKLFASSSKISEANGVGGDVGFKAGEASEHLGELKEVSAFVKPESKLETDMKGYDAGKDYHSVKPNALSKLPDLDSLTDKYRDIILDHVKYDETLPDDVSSRVAGRDLKVKENRQALLKELVEVAMKEVEGVERPALEKRVGDYLEKQLALRDTRPLMPSDCRAMASYVAGFDAGSGGVDVTHLPVMAGDVYEYTAPDASRAEWPFHYATVIMTDGADHVTMENAAAKASDKFSKMQYDHSWFFEMYGAGKGQTFDDHYKPLLDPE